MKHGTRFYRSKSSNQPWVQLAKTSGTYNFSCESCRQYAPYGVEAAFLFKNFFKYLIQVPAGVVLPAVPCPAFRRR